MKRLDGKVCIITGTGSGMGKAAAEHFCREGAKVVGCDINVEASRQVTSEVCANGGEMVSLEPCDLTNPANCRALADLAVASHGRIDVLFNNASRARFGWIDEITEQDWYDTINYELNLVFHMIRAAWPELKKRGGSIINTSSAVAWSSYDGLASAAHSAAKGGVCALTRQVAMEGGPHGIRVNAILPGAIVTNATKPKMEDGNWVSTMTAKSMLKRLGRPEEVAAVAAFLASDEASYITSAEIPVDAGSTAW